MTARPINFSRSKFIKMMEIPKLFPKNSFFSFFAFHFFSFLMMGAQKRFLPRRSNWSNKISRAQGAAANKLGNTSSRTITGVKQHWAHSVSSLMGDCSSAVWVLLQALKQARFDYPSYTRCWLCVYTELATGQCKMWGAQNLSSKRPLAPDLRKKSSWFWNSGRPPYATIWPFMGTVSRMK